MISYRLPGYKFHVSFGNWPGQGLPACNHCCSRWGDSTYLAATPYIRSNQLHTCSIEGRNSRLQGFEGNKWCVTGSTMDFRSKVLEHWAVGSKLRFLGSSPQDPPWTRSTEKNGRVQLLVWGFFLLCLSFWKTRKTNLHTRFFSNDEIRLGKKKFSVRNKPCLHVSIPTLSFPRSILTCVCVKMRGCRMRPSAWSYDTRSSTSA